MMRKAHDRQRFEHLYDAEYDNPKCKANIRMVQPRKEEVIYGLAVKPIYHGEELLWLYGSDYWSTDGMRIAFTGQPWIEE